MAENESAQEKTEEATPKRLRDAREKGQVPRSRELNTMVLLVASAGTLLAFGPMMGESLLALLEGGFTFDRADVFDTGAMARRFIEGMGQGFYLSAPLLVVAFAVALIAPISIGGWSFSTEALAPKLEKLDPIKGLKRVFGWQGLMELVKALAKFVVVTVVAGLLLWGMAGELLTLGNEPVAQGLAHASRMVGWAFLSMSAVMILIAAIDVPFQLWNHAHQLRMTRQEIKDEFKETEGRPEVKGRIRQLQREMAQRRMMEQVPKADVIVTNPTHFAVALKYGRRMNAPRVVAKGADLVARNIREVAAEHGVPLFEAPPLARALYYSTDIDQEIPGGLYVAVAQVLAYVYQLKNVTRGGPQPEPPRDLQVPDEFRQD
ncbi:MAG: flagellar type III secretion system protein FlhB [Gammaproteobacteria bacterium]|nr:flagellar type III secretion system protein FlhB [Gammaproteobacteria bacterium]MDX5374325.1 flagellar type III secretion system protein FlhB [Gammaproteobacteria bacterium]